jgi:hypothetical protein
MRWEEHVVHITKERKMYKVLVGKPDGKRPLGRPKCRWDQNGSYGDWIQLAQDRDWWWALVNTVMNLQVLAPQS